MPPFTGKSGGFSEMDTTSILKAIVFVCHFFFFVLTAIFFFLKFHKKSKIKFIMFTTGALWIIFGLIDFILGLLNVLSMFM